MSAAALAVLGVLSGFLVHRGLDWPVLAGELALVVAGVVVVRQLVRRPGVVGRMASMADATIDRFWPRPGPGPVAAFLAQLRGLHLRPVHVLGAGAYAVANWLLDAVCLWMSCLTVGVGTVTATQLLIAYCARMAAGSAIPVIPTGLGVIDSALVIGLVAGGIGSSAAIPRCCSIA